jgi:hypothetical protein
MIVYRNLFVSNLSKMLTFCERIIMNCLSRYPERTDHERTEAHIRSMLLSSMRHAIFR